MVKAPIRSGIEWIDTLFDLCVQILLLLARIFGISYNEINIWIFCVIWPIVTLLLLGVVVWQWIRIRELRRKLCGTTGTESD